MDLNNKQQKNKSNDAVMMANSPNGALQLSKKELRKLVRNSEVSDKARRPGLGWTLRTPLDILEWMIGNPLQILTLLPVRSMDEAYSQQAHACFWADDVLSRKGLENTVERRLYIVKVNKPRRLLNPSKRTIKYLQKFFRGASLEVESMAVLKCGKRGNNMVDYVNFNIYED